MSAQRRILPLVTLALAITALYLYRLDGTGVLSTDEPRYAAIGRSMAQTGDWITPRLWGAPWFEKPPLLYWLTAIGTLIGLNQDLAGRLPVALLSLAFLIVFFLLLRREYSLPAAAVSTCLLSTSAAWLAFSSLCVTDLPLSVSFSLAMLLALPLLRGPALAKPQTLWRLAAIGACLGLGMLAKGLVPIALALPFCWFLRRYWQSWWIAVITCLALAGPWYLAVYAKNGWPFVEEFFLKHHLQRLYSGSLQHVQPWYYYFPVLLAALFPWTPLAALLFRRNQVWDERRSFLLAIVGFGFAFFSVSTNKLPGYLLPLLPSLFALIGSQFDWNRIVGLHRAWLIACAMLVSCIPIISSILPQVLTGSRLSPALLLDIFHHGVNKTEVFYLAIPIAVAFVARRSWAGALLVLCVVSGGLYLKEIADPVLDRQVSARALWRSLISQKSSLCDAGLNRNWVYGMAFYNGSLLPNCGARSAPRIELSQQGNQPPQVKSIQ